jgi:dTDP-4-amino-4,6-dideoxygalactose transaminase
MQKIIVGAADIDKCGNEDKLPEASRFFPTDEIIPVTRSFLPPAGAYETQVRRVFESGQLTNRGPLVCELEDRLGEKLEVPAIIAMCNGTVPLQIALRILARGGEVITTPFSYVATTASIVWEHCTPVFADIEPEYLTIDPEEIEKKITPRTTCILATHVFGNPCDVKSIDEVAGRHNLPVIYDAAHAFGVRYQGKGLLSFGTISTCSFHATKIFHTGEGGALVCNQPGLFNEAFYRHNFGHDGPLAFHGLGINGKMSELNAAMGLSILPHLREVIEKRALWHKRYVKELDHKVCVPVSIRPGTEWNYAYAPVIFHEEDRLEKCLDEMRIANIIPRRYFYPSLNRLPFTLNCDMPIADQISRRILCLPLHHQLSENDFNRIIRTINKV